MIIRSNPALRLPQTPGSEGAAHQIACGEPFPAPLKCPRCAGCCGDDTCPRCAEHWRAYRSRRPRRTAVTGRAAATIEEARSVHFLGTTAGASITLCGLAPAGVRAVGPQPYRRRPWTEQDAAELARRRASVTCPACLACMREEDEYYARVNPKPQPAMRMEDLL